MQKSNEIGGRWWVVIGAGCVLSCELLDWGKLWEV